MSGDEDGIGRNIGDLVLDLNSLRTEVVEDSFIMHQVAQDRDGLGLRKRQGDGVPNPKTHAHMRGAQDPDGRRRDAEIGGLIIGNHVHFVLQSI